MRISAFFKGPLLRSAILIAGAAGMWSLGASLQSSLVWLAIAWASLATDPAGGGRFLAGIAVATLLAGLWTGVQDIRTMPDQVARRLMFDFMPTVPTLARPLVITLGFWALAAALVVGLIRGSVAGSWRRCLLAVGGVAAAFGLFTYVMLVRWPDPAFSHWTPPSPLGIPEVFLFEQPPVDLADVAAIPPRLPVPAFDVRKALSYGPHGYRNTLDLYLPKGQQVPLPVVVYIHGGGAFDGGTEAGQDGGLPDPWRDAFLARGLAIANINYRLVFADPKSRHDEVTGPFPAQIQDCLAAVRFLRGEADSLSLDPGRIGVMGHSFGGGLAALAGLAWDREEFLTDTRRGISSRVQAVVDSAGVNDVRTWGYQSRLNAKMWNLPSADYIDSNEFGRLYCRTGTEFDPMNKSLAAASAITYVRPDAPPFLSLYGFRDVAAQGEMLHERLKGAGVKSRLVIIPGAGHGLAAVSGTGDLAAEFLREPPRSP